MRKHVAMDLVVFALVLYLVSQFATMFLIFGRGLFEEPAQRQGGYLSWLLMHCVISLGIAYFFLVRARSFVTAKEPDSGMTYERADRACLTLWIRLIGLAFTAHYLIHVISYLPQPSGLPSIAYVRYRLFDFFFLSHLVPVAIGLGVIWKSETVARWLILTAPPPVGRTAATSATDS